MKFSTCSHQTTALCLQDLDDNPPNNLTVIDYGCGTSILAIATAKLSVSKVIAIDNDPQALTTTLSNIKANCVNHKIKTHLVQQQTNFEKQIC